MSAHFDDTPAGGSAFAAFMAAVQTSMQSHNGIPCTEDHIYTGETMACAESEDEPEPLGWFERVLAWLLSPRCDLRK